MSNAVQVNCRKYMLGEMTPFRDDNGPFLCCVGRRDRVPWVDDLFIHRIVAGTQHKVQIDMTNDDLSRRRRSAAVWQRMMENTWCKVDVSFIQK